MLNWIKKLFAAKDDSALKEAIAAGAVLIDVRTPGEFASGNLKGSVNIPLDRLNSQVQVLKKDKPVVVFCRSGNRSMAAKAILDKKGFQQVVNGGGIGAMYKLITNK